MAEEVLKLVPASALGSDTVPYLVDFSGQQRLAAGIRYRFGQNALSGPVAYKIAVDGEAGRPRLERELEVARYLGTRGGELLSKCVGYNFDDSPSSALVTYRGRPLADLARDESNWPPGHTVRRKIITDLLQGLELLRVSRIAHGGIGLGTLHWDGTTLQITDFGQAALARQYPDGRAAHHGDDIRAAGRVIYQVHTGLPPPDDPWDLRQQLEQVQDAELRDLLLQRDLVAGTDRDYVFAEDPDKRPTARTLLDRLDRRPRGVQWSQLVARDRAVRQEFRQLRERQRSFRAAYRPPPSRRPGTRHSPPLTGQPGQPGQSARPPVSRPPVSRPAVASGRPGPRPGPSGPAKKYARVRLWLPLVIAVLLLVLVLTGVL
jgi:hypothetical protein